MRLSIEMEKMPEKCVECPLWWFAPSSGEFRCKPINKAFWMPEDMYKGRREDCPLHYEEKENQDENRT